MFIMIDGNFKFFKIILVTMSYNSSSSNLLIIAKLNLGMILKMSSNGRFMSHPMFDIRCPIFNKRICCLFFCFYFDF